MVAIILRARESTWKAVTESNSAVYCSQGKRVSNLIAQRKSEKIVLFVILENSLPKLPSPWKGWRAFTRLEKKSKEIWLHSHVRPAISWWVQKRTCAGPLNYRKEAFISKRVACLAKAYNLPFPPNIKWQFGRGEFVHFDRAIAAVF